MPHRGSSKRHNHRHHHHSQSAAISNYWTDDGEAGGNTDDDDGETTASEIPEYREKTSAHTAPIASEWEGAEDGDAAFSDSDGDEDAGGEAGTDADAGGAGESAKDGEESFFGSGGGSSSHHRRSNWTRHYYAQPGRRNRHRVGDRGGRRLGVVGETIPEEEDEFSDDSEDSDYLGGELVPVQRQRALLAPICHPRDGNIDYMNAEAIRERNGRVCWTKHVRHPSSDPSEWFKMAFPNEPLDTSLPHWVHSSIRVPFPLLTREQLYAEHSDNDYGGGARKAFVATVGPEVLGEYIKNHPRMAPLAAQLRHAGADFRMVPGSIRLSGAVTQGLYGDFCVAFEFMGEDSKTRELLSDEHINLNGSASAVSASTFTTTVRGNLSGVDGEVDPDRHILYTAPDCIHEDEFRRWATVDPATVGPFMNKYLGSKGAYYYFPAPTKNDVAAGHPVTAAAIENAKVLVDRASKHEAYRKFGSKQMVVRTGRGLYLKTPKPSTDNMINAKLRESNALDYSVKCRGFKVALTPADGWARAKALHEADKRCLPAYQRGKDGKDERPAEVVLTIDMSFLPIVTKTNTNPLR